MTYRALVMALNTLVLIPSLGFVVLFILTSTKRTYKQLATLPLLVLPLSAALLVFRSIFLMLNQSPEARRVRDVTMEMDERIISIAIIVLVAASMWALLISLIKARHD